MIITPHMFGLRQLIISAVAFGIAAATASGGTFTSTTFAIHSDLGGLVGACDLGATLLMPSAGAPKALIILVAGSGPEDRDEHVTGGPEIRPFKDIAEILSASGYATLRFDKRESIPACQPSMINNPDLPYPTVEDLKNVIRATQANLVINGLPLVLLGHSDGVTDVLEIKSSNEFRIANLILLAGLGKYSIDATIIRQFNALLSTPGLSNNQIVTLRNLIDSGTSFFGKIHSGTAVRTDQFMNLYSKYWTDWIRFSSDNATIASTLRTPTLLIQGDQDSNVTKDDFDSLASDIKGVDGSQAVIITGVDHEFLSVHELHVDERLPADILDWLSRVAFPVAH